MRVASAVGRTLVLLPICLAGCTAVRVKPVTAENQIEHICIQENPDVVITDFVTVMQQGFQKHGITSQLISAQELPGCSFIATYTAHRRWDVKPFLSDAQIDIYRDGRAIAAVNYHMRYGGGYDLTKYADTSWKILPVVDHLLGKAEHPDRAKIVDVPPATPLASSAQGNR